MRDNDVIALICAQNSDPERSGLSDTCHNVLWSFKLSLTQGDNFIQRIRKVHKYSSSWYLPAYGVHILISDNFFFFFYQNCRHVEDAFDECNTMLKDSPGRYMSCVISVKQEHPDKITPRCEQFIERIETIIFRSVYKESTLPIKISTTYMP